MKKILLILALVAAAMTINAQTSDLKMLAVRGPVKRIVYTEGQDPILNVNMVSLNRNCLITQMVPDYYNTPNDKAVIKRNSFNMLKEWDIYWNDVSFNEGMRNYEYSYNSNGYVKTISAAFFESVYEAEPIWDETGKLKLLTGNGSVELIEYNFSIFYTYLDTDGYGNWIEAEYIFTQSEYDVDYPEDVQRTTSSGRITRRIEYYE